MAIINKIDRFNLVIGVIDRVENIGDRAQVVRAKLLSEIDENIKYAHEFGIDRIEYSNWTWGGR